jgi:hypothetical protein
MIITKLGKMPVTFVRKAKYSADEVKPKKPGTGAEKIFGLERPNHKYSERVNEGDGTHKYIYDKEKVAGDGSSKSNKQAQDTITMFRQVMQQDGYWKKFEKHFDDSDIVTLSEFVDQSDPTADPQMLIVDELNNMRNYLGAKASNYLPTSAVVGEYKKLIQMAANRPSEYSRMVKESSEKKKFDESKNDDANVRDLASAGFNEEQIMEFKRNPKKIKELISKLQNFSGE